METTHSTKGGDQATALELTTALPKRLRHIVASATALSKRPLSTQKAYLLFAVSTCSSRWSIGKRPADSSCAEPQTP